MNPDLLQRAKQKGSDAEYLHYVRCWPSCLSGAYSLVVDSVGFCEAAHVRHVSLGSGTAIKPEYAAVPLTKEEHQLTHQKGDSVFAPPEFWEKQATYYLVKWINGVKPPELEEQKAHWKKDYIIEYPGQMLALWLLLKKHFSKDKAPPVKVTLQRAVKRRSLKQNKTQWGPVYDPVLEYYEQHPADLGCDIMKAVRLCAARDGGGMDKDLVHWLMKQLFNGSRSTARLSTIQSAEYAGRIREYFLHEYEYEIPEPVSPDCYQPEGVNT